MDLEIQTRSTELDPSWRDLIDRSVERISERHPEVLRLHVTLQHAPHHRQGIEVASLLANVEGATLRADKQEEDAPAALRAAFAALEVELERHQTGRRHVVKSPGPRPRGSIKRVFRDAGYGFIRYEPGRDVYFHRAALHGLDLMTLEPGTPVEFEIEDGAQGPQASSVYPAGERGAP